MGGRPVLYAVIISITAILFLAILILNLCVWGLENLLIIRFHGRG